MATVEIINMKILNTIEQYKLDKNTCSGGNEISANAGRSMLLSAN